MVAAGTIRLGRARSDLRYLVDGAAEIALLGGLAMTSSPVGSDASRG
jgi:hypothetical protein